MTTKDTKTTVTYRTIYMPAKAEPRTKTFTGRHAQLDSETKARTWIRQNGVTVLSIHTEETE